MLASIPSPADGTISLGPLSIHAYGVIIAIGVVAAVWLAGRRLEASGAGTRDDMSAIALWAVGAGILGARLYYIVTDKSQPWKTPGDWIKIWQGGLGIPGGLIAGILVGVYVAHRRGVSIPAALTAAAPAIPLAQAIGRWGNWFNQELYGRPTSLPWGLQIDDGNLPGGGPSAQYPSGTLFHPTFLYESLWCLALCIGLLLLDKYVRLRPGRLMAVYVAGYAFGRFWVESLRIDPANAGGGWRLNQWTAFVTFILATGFLVVDAIRHRGEPVPATVPTAGDEGPDDGDGDTDSDGSPDAPAGDAAGEPDYVPEDE